MSSFFSRLTSTVTSAINEAVKTVAEVTAEFSLDSLEVGGLDGKIPGCLARRCRICC